ncbi:hypothetical protein ABZP36_013875 [Zizania latifolia]
MEELQEADVLWPETPPPPPPPSRGLPALQVLRDAATVFSCGSFGEPVSSPRSTSTALMSGGRCDGSVSGDASTVAGVDDGAVQVEEFQEADVLWPDDVDADTASDQLDVDDVGEFWWLCRDFGDAGSHMEMKEEEETAAAAAAGREVWRSFVSPPVDIPIHVAAARRHTTAMLMHRRRR